MGIIRTFLFSSDAAYDSIAYDLVIIINNNNLLFIRGKIVFNHDLMRTK